MTGVHFVDTANKALRERIVRAFPNNERAFNSYE